MYKYHLEFQAMVGTALGLLLNGGITKFYKKNNRKIEAFKIKQLELQKKYCVFENNNPKFITNEAGENKPVLIEGFTYEQLEADYNELLNTKVS